jgi:cold shock CspA family protein
MRHFGTVESFDETKGHGSIQPDSGHEQIGFERSAVRWRRSSDPTRGQRLSYEVRNGGGRTHAVKLRTIDPGNVLRPADPYSLGRSWSAEQLSPSPMRLAYMTLAGIAVLSLATPASAQWGQDRTYSKQLRVQIDTGVGQGRISLREGASLREKLNSLVQLERRFIPNGISGREYAVLFRRSAALAKDIRIASGDPRHRDDNQPVTWLSRSINGHWIPDARFAGLHPGDRFSGDARIGQHVTARIGSMPVQYRSDYVDTDQVYYGYDDGRVYQIDRKTRIILALLDIMR